MRKFTRKEFLEVSAGSVLGSVLGGLTLGCANQRKAGGEIRPVKILAVGDMHILDSESTVYPRKVIDGMNEEGGDIVLVCGDLAKDGQRSELELAKGVLDELEMPYYPVVGNHDALYRGEKEEALFAEIFSLEENNYHFVNNGIHFIGVDHGCGRAYHKNSVRPEAMAWIKETVKDIGADEPIVFFSHYPFAEGIKYQTPNSQEVLGLFEGKKLLAMISGHFHSNTERRENGVLMTTTACSSGRRGNHDGTDAKGFRVFNIDRDLNITTEFKEVEQ